MDKTAIIESYFQALEKGSYEDVIRLFVKNATVRSPLYGNIEASRFYKELFSDTRSSKITLKNTFVSANDPNVAAAQFVYSWTMKDGSVSQFECIDVFEFAPSSEKIESLTIIYDTNQTRQRFDHLD